MKKKLIYWFYFGGDKNNTSKGTHNPAGENLTRFLCRSIDCVLQTGSSFDHGSRTTQLNLFISRWLIRWETGWSAVLLTIPRSAFQRCFAMVERDYGKNVPCRDTIKIGSLQKPVKCKCRCFMSRRGLEKPRHGKIHEHFHLPRREKRKGEKVRLAIAKLRGDGKWRREKKSEKNFSIDDAVCLDKTEFGAYFSD